jgi:valyl-tRNA synthetase
MLDKIFDPKSFEKNFSFDIEASVRNPKGDPFMVLLPPPNVTGSLHMGHALCFTLQDILARYKRLRGYDVLFQPGLDHAGIVTQLLVEKQLYESGVEKGSLSRETLLKEIWFWKEHSGLTILDQMKVLGISCDFSRLRFTLDDASKKAVSKMFVKLFEDGLLFRGERMVNWDPIIGSAISDLEIAEKEIDSHLWYIKYKLEGSEEFITVATTRPETLFGDTAVAVNPKDERYKHFVGKKVIVPLCERAIPVIADKYADPEKGSGAVKITPAHDFNDFEIGKRHKLPVINIMNEHAELNDNVPEMFRHMDRFKARDLVVELLEKQDLLVKVEQIKQTVPFGDRSGGILEPRITKQWFINAEKLAAPAIAAVRNGDTSFIPKHWENLYFEWLENIRPWCISRQIWWGHRIPAWYGEDGQVFVAETEAKAKEKAIAFYGQNEVKLTQDEDVLDTWFSSSMWPYVTLGWPEKTPDLERFYSNAVVVTGFDIIFFWVSRMIMFGLHTMKKVPFQKMYIHGLVRDEKGQKMSKSKGNVVNPLDLCNKFGADAVRYTIASLSAPGRDIKMNEQSVEIGRNFLTKIWNVVRFTQMNGGFYNKEFDPSNVEDPLAKWIISKVKQMVINVEKQLDDYRFDDASREIYQCVWNSFCDWYVELIKPVLQKSSMDEESTQGYDLNNVLKKKEIRDTTAWAILQFVRVMYPFAPFISKKLAGEMGVLDISWPDVKTMTTVGDKSVQYIENMKEIITSIRSIKQCLHIPAGTKLTFGIEAQDAQFVDFISNCNEILVRMCGASLGELNGSTIPMVIDNAILHVCLGDMVDVKKEVSRLHQEIEQLEKIKNSAVARLNNPGFVEKADPEVVEEHKKRVQTLNEKIRKTTYIINGLEAV